MKTTQASTKRFVSQETREKRRQAKLGKPQSPETIEKRRQKNLGQKRTAETKEKIRQTKLGKPRSEETKEKIRQALVGRETGPCSPARAAAISAAKKGRPASPAMLKALEKASAARLGSPAWNKGKKLGPLSAERRRKIGQANIGHTLSPEARAKVSAAHKGKRFSDGHKQALSEAARQRWARDDVPAFRSKTEIRVGWLVEPFGFQPQFRIKGYKHPYDYGHTERRILIEVQGCYWHAHGCGVKMVQDDTPLRDQEHAQKAQEHGYHLVILWQCQEKSWPLILHDQGVF